MKKTKSKKTRIILSIMALTEVLMLIAGVTFSWIEGGKNGVINSNDIVISAGSSLTMLQDGKTTSAITIPNCILDETSSADGRNFFFPMADTVSNKTSEMTFREGTPTDQNKKYVSLDFQLMAGDSATDVFLGSGTIIRCDNENLLSALRMSFSKNDGEDPIVFKPTQMPGLTGFTYAPITAINSETGEATTTLTATKAYGDYYYSGKDSTPLFNLSKSETINVTLSIWLEGTEFSGDDIANTDLSIYIDFTTTVDGLVQYNFVDNTHGYSSCTSENWVSNKEDSNNTQYETMMYIYDKTESRYYSMSKSTESENSWVAYVPRSITNFTFRRYTVALDRTWNEWVPKIGSKMVADANGTYTYVAICGVANPDSNSGWQVNVGPCGGYWKDSNGTFRIYFRNEVGWNDLHCYAWKSSGAASSSTGAWPGKYLNHVSDNLYYIDLKESDGIAGIQFNNGDEYTTVYFDYNYGESTYAYAYNVKTNKEYTGAWPGAKLSKDSITGYYKLTFKVDNASDLTGDEKKFKVIVNNNSGSQYGDYQGDLGGKSYLFTKDSFELYNNHYELTNTDYFFNGFATWYKNEGKGNSGVWLYTKSDKSQIF